jgi:hypothetical protein
MWQLNHIMHSKRLICLDFIKSVIYFGEIIYIYIFKLKCLFPSHLYQNVILVRILLQSTSLKIWAQCSDLNSQHNSCILSLNSVRKMHLTCSWYSLALWITVHCSVTFQVHCTCWKHWAYCSLNLVKLIWRSSEIRRGIMGGWGASWLWSVLVRYPAEWRQHAC